MLGLTGAEDGGCLGWVGERDLPLGRWDHCADGHGSRAGERRKGRRWRRVLAPNSEGTPPPVAQARS